MCGTGAGRTAQTCGAGCTNRSCSGRQAGRQGTLVCRGDARLYRRAALHRRPHWQARLPAKSLSMACRPPLLLPPRLVAAPAAYRARPHLNRMSSSSSGSQAPQAARMATSLQGKRLRSVASNCTGVERRCDVWCGVCVCYGVRMCVFYSALGCLRVCGVCAVLRSVVDWAPRPVAQHLLRPALPCGACAAAAPRFRRRSTRGCSLPQPGVSSAQQQPAKCATHRRPTLLTPAAWNSIHMTAHRES